MHLADQTVFPPLASPPGSTDAMEQDSESVVEPTVHSGKDHQDTREVSRDQEDRSSPDEGEWTDPLLDSLKDEERDPLIVTNTYESALLTLAGLPQEEVERFEVRCLELAADSMVRVMDAMTRTFESQPILVRYITPAGSTWQLPLQEVRVVPAPPRLSPDEALEAQEQLMHSSFARYQENRQKFRTMSAESREKKIAAARKKDREDSIVALEAQIQLLKGGGDLPIQPQLPTLPAALMNVVNRQEKKPQFRNPQKRYNYYEYKHQEYKRNKNK